MAFDEPLVVIEIAEFLEGLVEVLDVGEGVEPEKLLLNRPVFLGQMVECIHAAAPVPRRS